MATSNEEKQKALTARDETDLSKEEDHEIKSWTLSLLNRYVKLVSDLNDIDLSTDSSVYKLSLTVVAFIEFFL